MKSIRSVQSVFIGGHLKPAIIGVVLATLVFAVVCLQAFGQDQKPETTEGQALINSLNGQALYQSYCATCHGNDAKGNGPMAPALKTPPPDLTQIAVRNGGMFSAKKVERIISGESELTSHGTREMPLWGPIFSQVAWDQDLGRVRIANLVKYLESIQSPPRIGGTQGR
jgi:mono/diheme cytochrome c family protein